MFTVYILRSNSNRRYYIGQTKDIDARIVKHNSGLVRSTKSGIPWTVVYVEKLNTRKEAYRRERVIKSYKSGEAFRALFERDH